MNRSWSKIFFYLIIFFGIIGLTTILINDPMSLLKTILIGAGVIFIVILLYKMFTRNDHGEASAYRKAVRQSKKRQKDRRPPARNSHLEVVGSKPLMKKKATEKMNRRGSSHLTVIDGKKKRRKKLFFLN